MPNLSSRLTTEEYNENFADIHPPFNDDQVFGEANRCLFCYDAPCMKACPTHIDVAQFIKQIATRNIKGSAKTIFDSNIFGGGCARVCPTENLCEGACVHNLDHKKPISIGQLQRYSTDRAIADNWQFYSRKTPVGKKVAVIGAGPAGLSAAHGLAQQGIDVTVFEKESKAGGLMTYGVAAYKVTPEFCASEVNYLLSIGGIETEFNKQLGKDFSMNELRKKYDAVFLAIGVGLARSLDVPGEDLNGVVNAMNYIYNIRTQDYATVPVGNHVAVIGMGMTAIDAATQSKRLGAEEVTIIYRRTKDEMPCSKKEYDLAKLDGCKIMWLAAPKEIIGKDGSVEKLVCSKMTLGEPDETGRRKPIETNETFALDVDMVIKATGQQPYSRMVKKENVKDFSGKIIVDDSGNTNIDGIFAGGDCVNGGKEVVDAVQAGKLAVKGIVKYLKL
jgi:glutamate synthase (NADPH/NADH) small chain